MMVRECLFSLVKEANLLKGARRESRICLSSQIARKETDDLVIKETEEKNCQVLYTNSREVHLLRQGKRFFEPRSRKENTYSSDEIKKKIHQLVCTDSRN